MRVSIDAAGRKVEVECDNSNTSPREVLTDVLATWKATDGSVPSEGPAYGFSSAFAGAQPSPMNMGHGRGIGDVRAGAE